MDPDTTAITLLTVSLAPLQHDFNQNQGRLRFVAVLSPT